MAAEIPADSLRGASSFRLPLPADFPLAAVLAHLGRDPGSRSERVVGNSYLGALDISSPDGGEPTPVLVELDFRPGAGSEAGELRARLSPAPGTPLPRHAAAEVRRRLLLRIGLAFDPAPFRERLPAALAREPRLAGLAPLVERRPGLTILGSWSPFQSLLWSIVGQQISLGFAFTLFGRLTELAGEPVGAKHPEGSTMPELLTPPRAERVAELSPEALTSRQFSRSKARYLIDAARAVVSGALPLDALPAAPPDAAREALLAVRGVGPWSAGYVMLRGLGFADAVPLGDAGLLRSMTRVLGLPERPDARRTEELLAPLSPYRGFAVYHFWRALEVPL